MALIIQIRILGFRTRPVLSIMDSELLGIFHNETLFKVSLVHPVQKMLNLNLLGDFSFLKALEFQALRKYLGFVDT